MAARSTTWSITNATKFNWSLSSATLSHGVWASSPPHIINAGTTVTFRAESDGFMTGDEGTVVYQFNEGVYTFYFDNPFIGADNFNVTPPFNYDNVTTQQTGDDQVLNTRCFSGLLQIKSASASVTQTQHTAQLICNTDSSVSSDIMENIDLRIAKEAAKHNYLTKYNSNANWQHQWKTFSDLLAVSTYKTS